MTDVLSLLPRMSFRGITVPITGARTASFSHEDVQHKFLYRDGAIVEAIGAQNWTFNYTVPMRQDIAKGPYRDLYTEVLPRLILAMRDRSPGELVDPELGTFRVRPTSLSSDLDVNKRDGTDVRVEFIHSPEIGDLDVLQGGVLDVSGAATQAGALDDQAALVNWEQEEPPEPTLDPFAALDGLGKQLEFQASRVSNKFADATLKLQNLEDTIDRLENPQVWPLKRSARDLRAAVISLAQQGANPGKKVITVKTRYAQTLADVATTLGLTVQDILRLNPMLALLPEVPADTPVRRYQ